MDRLRASVATIGLAIWLGASGAALAASATDSTHTLEIVDRVPKFQAFYKDATATKLQEAGRWALWQKEYGLAAVPPGPEGQALARKQLDAVWSRYPELAAQAETLEQKGAGDAQIAFDRINALFKTDGVPIHSRVVLYVGQFDGNAFTVPPMDGRPSTVMMPVETPNMALFFAHELTHSVNTQLADVKNGFGAPVGETMFLEGLAMHTAQEVHPGLPTAEYVAMPGDKDWFPRCLANKDRILAGIAPDLDKAGREVALKYTFGSGNTGMQREAYCAAWIVMGRLLKSGKTFPELARVPEDKMIATIREGLAMK